MNILCITSMYPTKKSPYGGVFVTRRIEALMALGNDVTVIALVKSEKTSLRLLRKVLGKKQKEIINAKDISTPSSSVKYQVVYVRVGVLGELLDKITCYKYSYTKAAVNVYKTVTDKAFNVVHAHWLYPTGWLAEKVAKKLSLPCVLTCHGSDVNIYMKQAKYHKNCISTLENAACVEFVSNALLSTAKAIGYSGCNAVIAPNGIVEQAMPHIIKDTNITTVGFVGSLIDVKRVRSFPEIFRNILENTDKIIRFLVVGSGELSEWLKKECEGMPLVLTGQLASEAVLEKMAEMDVMILPSKSEGWPCVVLEAQSCGTPVIGSDRGGIPEAIGDNRFIVHDGDLFESRFAECVLGVIDGRIDYDKATLSRRCQQYTWETLQRQAVERYMVLLNE